MKIYKLLLNFKSGLMTPLHADIIFGQLCWVIAYTKGPKALGEFLAPFIEGEPPFILSDGFPTGFLPKPLSSDALISDPEERKMLRKLEFVDIQMFETIRTRASVTIKKMDSLLKRFAIAHNTVSRLTNSTLAEAGVYSLQETFIPFVDVYLKTRDEATKERMIDLIKRLSKTGYGRKKSIGKGHFSFESVSDATFKDIDGANGFVTLSSFCPTEADPTVGQYKTFVKYGKMGEEFTFCGNPFKRPLVMIKSGSVFRTGGLPKEFYGRIVSEVSPIKKEVVQYGYAFAIPVEL